jgi:hypothetical protein
MAFHGPSRKALRSYPTRNFCAVPIVLWFKDSGSSDESAMCHLFDRISAVERISPRKARQRIPAECDGRSLGRTQLWEVMRPWMVR